MNDLNSLFEEDANALTVKDDDLSSVGALAKRAKELEKEIEDLDKVLSERKEQQRKLLEDAIPAKLEELGMKKFTMSDGSQIEVKPFYGATIKEENRAAAYEWLRKHGFDDIIKNTVSVRFGRGEDDLCAELLNLLREKNYPVDQAQKIEPATLKAWVRERVERGDAFPQELFGAFIGQKATIKSA
jgi:alanyl-tRNA synthetase